MPKYSHVKLAIRSSRIKFTVFMQGVYSYNQPPVQNVYMLFNI